MATEVNNLQVTVDDPSKIPDFSHLPELDHQKAFDDWLWQELSNGSVLVNESSATAQEVNDLVSNVNVPLSMEVDVDKLQHPVSKRLRTPTSTPLVRSVDSSPVFKKPRILHTAIPQPPKSLMQQPQSPASLVDQHLPASLTCSPKIIPVDITLKGLKQELDSLSAKIDPTLSASTMITRLETIHSSFTEGLKEMQKLVHDTKLGLAAKVSQLLETVTVQLKPDVAQLKLDMFKLQPEVSKLSETIKDKKDGFDARLKVLEGESKKKLQEVHKREVEAIAVLSPEVQAKLDQMEIEISSLKAKVTKNELDISMLVSWADVFYQDQKSMHEHMMHNTARHMQHELIVGGIKQTHHENCKLAAIDFFQNKIGVTVNVKDVWVAYRKGSGTTKTVQGQHIKCPPQWWYILLLHYVMIS